MTPQPNDAAGPGAASPAAPEPAAAQATESTPEKLAQARELVEGLLTHMGLELPITLSDKPDGIHVSFDPGGAEMFAQGRRGELIESMGYLVNKALNRDEQGRRWVYLSAVGGSATAAAETVAVDPEIQSLAEDLAAQARTVGPFWFGPIPARHRRTLEAALLRISTVKVRAEGEGPYRRIAVESV